MANGARESLGFAVVQMSEINARGGEWTTWLSLVPFEDQKRGMFDPQNTIAAEEAGKYFSLYP